ncbi:MAG: ATP-binding protein [Planctomycetaceae bacterium]
MVEWLFQRCRQHYILVMMLVTRLFCLVGGALVIYYVHLTITLAPAMRDQFTTMASVVILLSTLMTVLLALWETSTLRGVLADIRRGKPIEPARSRAAGAEAVLFAGRHHQREAVLVPATTVVPLCAYLWLARAAPTNLIVQVTIAGFLGISAVLMLTFFSSERWMARVTRHLIEHGMPVPFEELAASRILVRMNVCFGLAIAVTALMIGGLAFERAREIGLEPERAGQLVHNLHKHTVVISLTAVATGLVLSRLLANSVASRVKNLVEAMKRVEAGSFSERLRPTGNDEIDLLTRQFNAMVEQLDRNDHTIRELNAGLEQKVRLRTRQLSRSKLKLQRSLKKLREYDQLKTDFFSNISHELRTPLTMILSPIDRIIESFGGELPPRVASLINVVRVNGNRLLELINQLLEFSKLEAGRAAIVPSAVNLNTLATDLVAAAQPLAEQRGLQLRMRLAPDLPVIGADAEKIETIVRNLLSNALKFTPVGGVVEIETRLSDGQVQLAVTDTGIGIAPEDYHRVFERFTQIDSSTSRQYSGTGLGLAMVKELVELHGGQMHLESEVGLGSRFWFTLPATAPAGSATPAAHSAKAQRFADLVAVDVEAPGARRGEGLSPDTPRVLVADDTPEMRSLIAEILSDHYRVVTAVDGRDAWEQVSRDPPDLIISDVMMPNVDGYEFCRRVKEQFATAMIPFIMLTAKADLTMKIEGLNRGADDYLVKPFSPEELRARVKSLLRLRKLTAEIEVRNGELQEALAELRETQAQLVQSEKMSSLGQLVAGIAHEINNAINAVYNGIQPLQARAKKLETLVGRACGDEAVAADAQLRQEIETSFKKITGLAEVIENGAARTARIVRDLRTFSHPGSETFEEFNLREALDMCLNLLANQLRHRVQVHVDYGEIGLVRGPSGQLNQVFMNVLNNAQQAIADKGDIFIRTSCEGNMVHVSVRDTGCGIPEEIRNRIFDPFFTTKAPGTGTGLGLSLSYGIMTGIGGTIECRSQPGAGSEFIVTFPARCEAASQVVPHTSAAAAAAGSAVTGAAL